MATRKQKTTGQLIREARERAKMTQDELAKKVGVRQPDLSDWERDEHAPSVPSLKALAVTLGVAMDSLISQT